jgi:hypothetical protein
MDNNEVKLHEEIQKMEYEPLDPVELKLALVIGLGIVMLVCSSSSASLC